MALTNTAIRKAKPRHKAYKIAVSSFLPQGGARQDRHFGPRGDDIADLTFISGKINRKISDKAPSVYLPPIVEKQGLEPFSRQAVPMDAALLELNQYRAFLEKRRVMIANRRNEFLRQSA